MPVLKSTAKTQRAQSFAQDFSAFFASLRLILLDVVVHIGYFVMEVGAGARHWPEVVCYHKGAFGQCHAPAAVHDAGAKKGSCNRTRLQLPFFIVYGVSILL